MEVRADPEKGPTVHGRLPSDEDLIVVLHRLRPFILNDEPYSYNRVNGILARAFTQQPLRDVFKEERRRYDGRAWQQQLKITSGSTTLNSDDVVMKWLSYPGRKNGTATAEEVDFSVPGGSR